MAASQAVLANRALRHLGVAGVITTLSSDTSAAGKALWAVYPQAVTDTLTAADWSCARRKATLTLVETFADTETREWLYSYRLPEDCLTPRRVIWGVRNPRADQEWPFTVEMDPDSTDWDASTAYVVGDYARLASSGVWYRCILATTNNTPPNATYWVAVERPPKLLLTDRVDAVLEYTMDLTDPTRFDEALESAIAARLAYEAAPSITVNGSAVGLRDQVAALWNHLVGKAVAEDYMARQRDVPAPSGYQAARHIGRFGRMG